MSADDLKDLIIILIVVVIFAAFGWWAIDTNKIELLEEPTKQVIGQRVR